MHINKKCSLKRFYLKTHCVPASYKNYLGHLIEFSMKVIREKSLISIVILTTIKLMNFFVDMTFINPK